jgi:deoxyadenosine/deoxycytidine kinase
MSIIPEPPRIITVEGLIGVGKTTLTQNLAKTLGYKVVQEPVEDNPYLSDFYRDPKRHALEMQLWLLRHAHNAHLESEIHLQETQQGVIHDRSIYGMHLFMKQHWMDGNVDLRGYKTYQEWRYFVNATLTPPDIAIFLMAKPTTCLKRIQERGRECEQGISLKYLENLAERHMELMEDMNGMGTTIMCLDWEEFQPINEVLKSLPIWTDL